MYVLIIIIGIIATSILMKKNKKFNIYSIINFGYIKECLIIVGCFLFIIILLIYADVTFKAAYSSIYICINIIFPSLFPFFVVTEILNRTNGIKIIGMIFEPIMRPLFRLPGCSSLAVILGLVSGFPTGGIITSSLRNEKLLTKTEAERLIAFTNNAGPLFIIGAVGVGMFNSRELGYLLLVCQITASITVGFLFRFYGDKTPKKNMKNKMTFGQKSKYIFSLLKKSNINIGEILAESVKKSINTLLLIGGFIVFFSVIINVLTKTGIIVLFSNFLVGYASPFIFNEEIVISFISGVLELTNGIDLISKNSIMTMNEKLLIVSFLIGFAGICVYMQVKSVVFKSDLSLKFYILGKIVHGIIASIYMVVALYVVNIFNILDIHKLCFFEPIKIVSQNKMDMTYVIIINSLAIISILLLIKKTIRSKWAR